MSALNRELQQLEAEVLEGTTVPNETITLTRPTRQDGAGVNDAVAQIVKVSVDETPKGDHYFRLTIPDTSQEFRGAVEVDDTQEGDPSLKILATGIFEEDPSVLGPLARVALTESGVSRAIVEARFTNLSEDFLLQAGGTAVEAAEASPEGLLIAFDAIPPSRIHAHPLAA